MIKRSKIQDGDITGFPQRTGIPVRTGIVLEFRKVLDFLKSTGKCT